MVKLTQLLNKSLWRVCIELKKLKNKRIYKTTMVSNSINFNHNMRCKVMLKTNYKIFQMQMKMMKSSNKMKCMYWNQIIFLLQTIPFLRKMKKKIHKKMQSLLLVLVQFIKVPILVCRDS